MHPTIRILEGLTGLRELAPASVLSIGNFDGVHRGHLRIIELARVLRAKRQAAGDGGRVALVTFEPHPLTALRPKAVPPRLTPVELKRSLLAAAGVDDLVELPPTKEVLGLSAEDFFAILRDEVRPSHVIEGDTFNFGRDRGGNVERLREWCADSSIALHVIDPVRVALLDMQVVDVNSSLVRWLLANGRARDAAICLARPYTVHGVVVEGFKRGRTIGVPTANLQCDHGQLVPADGVYVGRSVLDGRTYPAAISIGTAPTFDGTRRQVEAHLIGFHGDLYGRTLSVDLVDWLRDQMKFRGVEALKEQLVRDVARAEMRSELDVSRVAFDVARSRSRAE